MTPLTQTPLIELHPVMQADYAFCLLQAHLQQEVKAKLVQQPTCSSMRLGPAGLAHNALCSGQESQSCCSSQMKHWHKLALLTPTIFTHKSIGGR